MDVEELAVFTLRRLFSERIVFNREVWVGGPSEAKIIDRIGAAMQSRNDLLVDLGCRAFLCLAIPASRIVAQDAVVNLMRSVTPTNRMVERMNDLVRNSRVFAMLLSGLVAITSVFLKVSKYLETTHDTTLPYAHT